MRNYSRQFNGGQIWRSCLNKWGKSQRLSSRMEEVRGRQTRSSAAHFPTETVICTKWRTNSTMTLRNIKNRTTTNTTTNTIRSYCKENCKKWERRTYMRLNTKWLLTFSSSTTLSRVTSRSFAQTTTRASQEG